MLTIHEFITIIQARFFTHLDSVKNSVKRVEFIEIVNGAEYRIWGCLSQYLPISNPAEIEDRDAGSQSAYSGNRKAWTTTMVQAIRV